MKAKAVPSMRATTPSARRHLPALSRLAHCPTDGVVVSVGRRNRYPQVDGRGRVFLPECLFDADMRDILPQVWRHELQHARDALDGVLAGLTRDEAERRARQAEQPGDAGCDPRCAANRIILSVNFPPATAY